MIGVDESGRGSWAGPLFVVAVRLRKKHPDIDLKDSKQLSDKKRRSIAKELKATEEEIGYASVSASLIDEKGLTWAQIKAMATAVAQIKPAQNEEIVVDGSINYLKDYYPRSRAIIKADQKYPSVMAASILAKVARDDEMIKLGQKYPAYSFGQHKGYGTALHRRIIKSIGPCASHRLSYKPISKMLN